MQNSVTDVTELMEFRKKMNAGDARISVNDFIIMAATKALKAHPRINASYTEGKYKVKSVMTLM